jgi:hypothetical protein
MKPRGTLSRVELCQYRRALAKTVKSLRAGFAILGCGLGLTGGLVTISTRTHAQSLLLGPAPRLIKAKPVYDPTLPTGAERPTQLAIDEPELTRLCSGTHPLCVAWSKTDTTSVVLDALSELEAAYDRLVLGMRLPAPLASDEGQPLTWRLTSTDEPLSIGLLPRLAAPFDVAAVVCRSGTGTELERRAHLCVGEAIAARLDAGETPEVRRAYALDLWWTVGKLTASDEDAILRAQSNPQAPLFSRDDQRFAGSSALFFEYMTEKYGTSALAAVPTALLALSAQKTAADAWRFQNSPDVTDVVRATFDDREAVWATRILEFAFLRAQANQSEHGLLPLAWLGTLATPRIDWLVKASTLPRRVAPALPLQPWGAVYIRLDLDVPTEKLDLGVKIEWEAPVAMRWQIAKLDSAGAEIGRIDIAFEQRGTEIERRVVALEGVSSLLIAGTNLGGVDLAHPFDPDHEPFEAHGCTVYIGKM